MHPRDTCAGMEALQVAQDNGSTGFTTELELMDTQAFNRIDFSEHEPNTCKWKLTLEIQFQVLFNGQHSLLYERQSCQKQTKQKPSLKTTRRKETLP